MLNWIKENIKYKLKKLYIILYINNIYLQKIKLKNKKILN